MHIAQLDLIQYQESSESSELQNELNPKYFIVDCRNFLLIVKLFTQQNLKSSGKSSAATFISATKKVAAPHLPLLF